MGARPGKGRRGKLLADRRAVFVYRPKLQLADGVSGY